MRWMKMEYDRSEEQHASRFAWQIFTHAKKTPFSQSLLFVCAPEQPRSHSMPPFEETRLTMSNHANTDTKHYSLFYLHGFNGALLFPQHFSSSRFLLIEFSPANFSPGKQNMKISKQQSVPMTINFQLNEIQLAYE